MPEELQKRIDREQASLRAKQKLVGDPNWKPARGAGMIQEKVWKKYAPKSKDLRDYKKKKGGK